MDRYLIAYTLEDDDEFFGIHKELENEYQLIDEHGRILHRSKESVQEVSLLGVLERLNYKTVKK